MCVFGWLENLFVTPVALTYVVVTSSKTYYVGVALHLPVSTAKNPVF